MAKTRHRSRAPLVAMADMFICVSAVFLFFLQKPPDEARRQVDARKAEVAALESRIRDLRATRDETEADVTAIKGQIEVEREHLAQKRRAYEDWDIVVQQFVEYAALSREPDYHFYLRTSGVYSSASRTKWTKAGLEKWLVDVGSQAADGSRVEIVFYAEDGANDMVIHTRGVIDEINEPTHRIRAHYVVLPSGVIAGPNQIIHAKQGGGK